MDTDGFVLGVKAKDFDKELNNFDDLFDSSNLSDKYELFSQKKQK